MIKATLAAILAVASQARYISPQDSASYQEAARAAEALNSLLSNELDLLTPRVDFSVSCTKRTYD